MKTGAILAAFAAVALWCSGLGAAPKPARDQAFEQKIDAELRARDPEAADLFAEATAAADRGDADGAADRFERVRAAAPWFVHATRRLCGVEVKRGHRDRAISLDEVVPKKQAFANVYAFVPVAPVDPEKIEKAIATAMNRPATPSDSHPPPVDRIAWVTKLAAPVPGEEEGDADDAWSLLGTREAIEERMTETVRRRLATRGIPMAKAE